VELPRYRYFVRIEDEKILSVFRFMFDDENDLLVDEIWLDGAWQDSDGRIVTFLFKGDTNIDEVSEVQLREMAPELFGE